MRNIILHSIAPVAAIWTALIVFALLADAHWPSETQPVIAFVALAVVATFLMLVALIMLRRMHYFDRLTLSLALAFGACALMPFYLMANRLWPAFFTEHRFLLTIGTAIVLIACSVLAMVSLLTTPDDGEQREAGNV